jgi:hypothetical protein
MLGKLLPPGVSFTLELTLETGTLFLKSAALGDGYEVRNPALYIPEVQVHDQAFMARVANMMRSGISWRGLSFKTHINTIDAGAAGQQLININDRSMNLRGICTVVRRTTLFNAVTVYSLSKSSIQYFTQYQYSVGSQQYPPHPVDIYAGAQADGGTAANTIVWAPGTATQDVARCFSEAQRFWGTLHRSGDAGGVIGMENFAQSELNHGTGILCVDLQTYSDSGVVSGVDTASAALPIQLTVTRGVSATTNAMTAHSFCLHDRLFRLGPDGSMSVVH